MAKSIFNQSDREQLLRRIDNLKPDSKGLFGTFTAPRMVCHLIDSLRVASGQTPTTSKNNFMSNPVLRWLIVYVIPWPKGKAKTVPEMLATQPADFRADISTLREQLNAAAQRGAGGSWAPHPAFGAISGKMYGDLIYKHFDHHLSQFGV